MTVTPKTRILSSRTTTNAATSDHWFETEDDGSLYTQCHVSMTAGTGTVRIEGRNTPADATVTLADFTATDAVLIQRMPQMRVTYVAPAGLTALVTLAKPALDYGS